MTAEEARKIALRQPIAASNFEEDKKKQVILVDKLYGELTEMVKAKALEGRFILLVDLNSTYDVVGRRAVREVLKRFEKDGFRATSITNSRGGVSVHIGW